MFATQPLTSPLVAHYALCSFRLYLCQQDFDRRSNRMVPPGSRSPVLRSPREIKIDFAAPNGPNPEVDEGSVEMFKDDESVKFLQDPELSDVNPAEYDAIFYVGGHGPMIDLPEDPNNIKLANAFYQSGKITSAVCHGPGALVGVTDASGKSIFDGRNATGFSDAEEEQVGKVKDVPFLLETRIKELGGKYTKAEQAWGPKVVVDGHVITGQNPASAAGVGKAILEALSA
ncbi:chaperone protein HSP31 [Rhizoctonia solani]|uniref:D-lactate dehydratase n=1 Tax=Rhizoctonia solani TaxID=456999 RepID=A0A8H8NUQ9_9AGAM|nr:chaperone protein HSP31 [Rhizoctonia solani]QRW19005.1 chaperone protein HSP31 [Rhizoctonia solani]